MKLEDDTTAQGTGLFSTKMLAVGLPDLEIYCRLCMADFYRKRIEKLTPTCILLYQKIDCKRC